MNYYTTRLIITFLLMATMINGFSQNKQAQAMGKVLRETNVEALKQLSTKLKQKEQERLDRARQLARKNNWVWKKTDEHGRMMHLMGATKHGRPLYYVQYNDTAAETVSTDEVWPGGAAGLTLDGTGMVAGEWDGGGVLTTHQEFNNTGSPRVIQNDIPEEISDHATHVAGTILAGGVLAEAKGMAYNAELLAHDWFSDESEMANAAAAGMLISNHSYGYVAGWDGWCFWHGDSAQVSDEEDWRFGFYGEECEALDALAFNAPYYLICKAAGNDRGDGAYCDYWSDETHPIDGGEDGYDCIGWKGNAKNILTVAAVKSMPGGYTGNPEDVIMTDFSSWGPSDDGRIKPDISANGHKMKSSVGTGDSDYDIYSGTSMATPSATGSLLLLQEHYSELYGAFMKASTLKALAIHTADEAGPNDGPDYMFGWGLLNTQKAADVISKKNDQSFIEEISLAEGETYTFEVNATGIEPLVATIVWTDPAGTPVSTDVLSPYLLDPSDKMLVNDLDMTVTENATSSVSYPYMLNRDIPAAAATTGDNDIDNVEKIVVANTSNGTYTITISHEGTITDGPQAFSLIVTGVSNGKAVVNTGAIENITLNSAVVNGEVLLDNGAAVTERGIVYSTAGLPDLTDTKLTAGSGLGAYSVTMSGLTTSTRYFVRAYAANAEGTAYGAMKEFVTPCQIITSFPYAEDFGEMALPGCWEIKDVAGTGEVWKFADNSNFWTYEFMSTTADNGFAMLDSDDFDSGQPENSDLVTPTFDFTAYEVVNVKFEHHFETFADAKGQYKEGGKLAAAIISFSYSLDGGYSWHQIKSWEGGDTENAEIFSQDVSDYVAGEYMVQFKWNYNGFDDWYWCVDDFEVTVQAEACTPPTTQVSNFTIDQAFDEALDISWTNGNGDATLVIASRGNAVNATIYNASVYNANATFGLGDEIGTGNYVVYNGSADNFTMDGLTSGTDYHFALYTYNTADNCYMKPGISGQGTTSGDAPCVHCASSGKTFATENINYVSFSDLTNTSGREEGYSDFTNLTANVTPGANYDIDVHVNTDGTYTDYVRVWIDWNQDCDFDDDGESYDLGTATNVTEGSPSECPYTISVPADAHTGVTIMRIASRWNRYAEPCETEYYGEVEDYSVSVGTGGATSQVTFEVINGDNSIPVTGASIAVSGQTLTTDINGEAVADLVDGTHSYVVSKTGFNDFNGSVTVSGGAENVSVALNESSASQYSVTFNVTDGSAGIEGASLAIDGQTLTTNASGEANINLENGTYNYVATKNGFDDFNGSVTVDNAEENVSVILTESTTPQYTVTFNVTDGATAIEAASVAIDGETLTTNASGVATIDLENGTYNYTVTKSGYDSFNGSVEVNSSAISVDVTLNETSNDYYTVPFVENFDNAVTPALPEGWAVENNNSDAYSWETSTSSPFSGANSLKIRYNSAADMDDWAVSKGIMLEAGQNYSVSFYYKSQSSYFTENLTVYLLESQVGNVQSGVELTDLQGIASTEYQLATIDNVTVSSTGLYYIGFHGNSLANMYNLYVDELAVNTASSVDTYTVTFNVTDGSTAIEGASVAINDETLTTNASGVATIELENGTYNYIVTKNGFDDFNGTVVVNNAADNASVTLTESTAPHYAVTFNVTDGSTAIEGASVAINGETLTTNASGIATIDMVNGSYNYIVNKNGYQEINGSVVVSEGDVSESVSMQAITSIIFSASVTDVTCNGGNDGQITFSSVAGGSGTGYAYSVDAGTTWHSNTVVANLGAGSYTVVVKDSETNLSDSEVLIVEEPDEISDFTITTQNVTTYGGNDGSIEIAGTTGGVGAYQFSIDNGNNWQASNLFENLTEGTYNIAIMDGNGCQADAGSVTITQPNLETYTVTFHVTADGVLLEGASIAIGTEILTTNENGICATELTDGSYNYTVTASNYDQINGVVEVNGADVTENIAFVGLSNDLSTKISVYPNPTNGSLNIDFQGEYTVTLTTSVGNVVMHRQLQNKQLLDLTNHSNGLYILSVETDAGIFMKRIIINR
jgi:hypothetical protein